MKTIKVTTLVHPYSRDPGKRKQHIDLADLYGPRVVTDRIRGNFGVCVECKQRSLGGATVVITGPDSLMQWIYRTAEENTLVA